MDNRFHRRKVLVVDDQAIVARAVQRTLEKHFDVETALSELEARQAMENETPDILICDFDLGGGETCINFLEYVAERYPEMRRVLFSASQPEEWQQLLDRDLVHVTVMKPGRKGELLLAITSL